MVPIQRGFTHRPGLINPISRSEQRQVFMRPAVVVQDLGYRRQLETPSLPRVCPFFFTDGTINNANLLILIATTSVRFPLP